MHVTSPGFKNMWVQLLVWLVLGSVISGYDVEEKVLFPKLTNVVDHSENEVCNAQSRLYKEHLENLTLWAHEMWDASAKSAYGVLRGNLFQLGDWDECITVDGPYKTQYCLATITSNAPTPNPPRDPLSVYYEPFETVLNKIHKTEEISRISRHEVHMGLCVPASCSLGDLEQSLNVYLSTGNFSMISENVTYKAKVPKELCQKQGDLLNLDSLDIGFCLLSLVVVLLVILATLYDYCQTDEEAASDRKPKQPTFSHKICLAFSLRKNFLDLPKADESNPALSTLYGIKTFSIFMVIMDHRFGTFITGAVMNYDYIEKQYRSKYAAFLFHGDLFVDSFFVLSGLLVTYGLLVQFDKKVINPFFIVFLRYIRLTPVYAFVIFFWSTMLNHLGTGPLWNLVIQPEITDCRQNWWTNLLYISNYVYDDHMCMTHSWYLPCDLHFFIVGVIVVLVMKKNRQLGLGLLTFLFILSVVTPFVLTVVYQRPALVQFYPSTLSAPKVHTDFRLTYTKTHTRAAAYFVGMFAGYLYYRLKNTTKRLSRVASHALTLGSFMILFACVGTGVLFYDRYHPYNAIEAGAYAALHRVAWSAGTVGVLISASYGHATILRSVLTWSPWIPLGKLVYGAYLIHMSIQFRSVGMNNSPKYFTYFDVICLALGDIVIAFILALFLYLGIEAPIRKIFKELLSPLRSPHNKPAAVEAATTTAEENTSSHQPHDDSRL